MPDPTPSDRRVLTAYRDHTPVEIGDVAVDLSDGTILSRRDGYWVDGGFQPHVQNYYCGDDDQPLIPLLRVEDEAVDGPLDLLYRPPSSPSTPGGDDGR